MTNEGSLEGSLGSLRQFHLTNEGSLEGSLGSLRKFYLTNEGSLGGSLEGSLEGSRHLTCLLTDNFDRAIEVFVVIFEKINHLTGWILNQRKKPA